MDWGTILKALGIVSVGSAALVYLAKTLFSQGLSMSLEWYKKQLDTTREIEVERLRNELRMAAFEHETRFSRLHDERAHVVADLYKRLVRVQFMVGSVQQDFADASYRQDLEGQVRGFNVYLNENRIYLPESLCDQLAQFGVSIGLLYLSVMQLHENQSREVQDRARESADKILERIPTLRSAIEKAFRDMIGVREDPVQSRSDQDVITPQ